MVLAKELATLDDLSGGRVELGIGVGWLGEEFDALGVPWHAGAPAPTSTSKPCGPCGRGQRQLQRRVRLLRPGASNPKPAGAPCPIVIGGHSRTPPSGPGAWATASSRARAPDDLAELIDIVRQTAAANGRDPSAIEITAGTAGIFGDDPVGAVEEMAAQGVEPPHRARVRDE